jgi:hypothetical protein
VVIEIQPRHRCVPHDNSTIPNGLRKRAYFRGRPSTVTVSRSQHSTIAQLTTLKAEGVMPGEFTDESA